MSIGIALVTQQKREPNGPPFVPASARNGLSVDATGAIVLGQDVGAAGDPAVLLNAREVPMNGFPLTFRTPANSTLIRFNNAALNPFLLQATVNSQWSNIIAQNLSAGNLATSFLGTYNDLGNNMSIVKTSSTYAGSFGFPANTGILYSSSVGGLGTDAMAFVSEAGFYWSPNTTGAGGVTQVSMRMLTAGNLQIHPINATGIIDNGGRLQVRGQFNVSGFAANTISPSFASYQVRMSITSGQNGVGLIRTSNDASSTNITFAKARGTDPLAPAPVQVNDQLGRIEYGAYDSGSVLRFPAEIRCLAAGAPGAGFVPSNFAISTTNAAGVVGFKYWFSPEGGVGINTPSFPLTGIALEIGAWDIRILGTSGNSIRFANAAAAPGVTAGPVFTNYYGGNTNALGDPVQWLLVNIAGTDRKIPVYAV